MHGHVFLMIHCSLLLADTFLFQNEIKSEYKSVCYGLPCYVPKEETCKLILPSDGTVCGDKKV